jgi:hypothetical protein
MADFLPMSTVQEIKVAIEQLPLEERAELVAELCGWQDGKTRPLGEILGDS